MFDKFGEMNSYREINELAENLFNEGDLDSIKAMAAENGIPSELIEMYLCGDLQFLCDAETAAIGKLDMESKELKPVGLMVDWVNYVKGQCMESELLAIQVRKKGKTLKGCIGELMKWAFKNQWTVDKDITKAAGINAGKVTFGAPGMGEARKIIKAYYMGGAQ